MFSFLGKGIEKVSQHLKRPAMEIVKPFCQYIFYLSVISQLSSGLRVDVEVKEGARDRNDLSSLGLAVRFEN